MPFTALKTTRGYIGPRHTTRGLCPKRADIWPSLWSPGAFTNGLVNHSALWVCLLHSTNACSNAWKDYRMRYVQQDLWGSNWGCQEVVAKPRKCDFFKPKQSLISTIGRYLEISWQNCLCWGKWKSTRQTEQKCHLWGTSSYVLLVSLEQFFNC